MAFDPTSVALRPQLFAGSASGYGGAVSVSIANGADIFTRGAGAHGVVDQRPFETMSEMVDCYVGALQACGKRNEYYLLGYSAGCAIAHAVATRIEQSGGRIRFLGLLDGVPPGALATSREMTTLDVLKEQLEGYIQNIDDYTDYDVLLNAGLKAVTHRGILPETAPAEYANRIIEEMLLSAGRIKHYTLDHGSFDAVYFSADEEVVSADIRSARDQWRAYCKNVDYISIDSKHLTMLKETPSQQIADYINAILHKG